MTNKEAIAGEHSQVVVSSNGGMKSLKRQKWLFLLLAIAPSYIGYLLFTLYPNILSVYYSFLKWNGLSEPKFVGIDNFITMFNDHFFWRALYHNLLLMITIPPSIIIISLGLSYILINKGFRETPMYKIIFFFPNVLSAVVITLLWIYIYDGSNGLINGVLKVFGYDNNSYYWLSDPKTALWLLLPPTIWGAVGFYIVIFINAMKGIPKTMYEAAILEGASHLTRLFSITMPLISPIIKVSFLFLFLGSFKGFEMMLIMTNGGPAGSTEVIGLYMFNQAFSETSRNYGYASAIGLFLFVLLVLGKVLIDKFIPDSDVEY
ncbi:ABC transporter permease [Paenibacillus sp. FSL H8-0548]|uniref:carbohydrate ABC transporter permease n=1 Tax=Paenibacillus sp. FSL H8-0548 TaxID=1920422 RepID=UPI00096C403A|nr:sugar ABC transporter permease [Paenibacillus sp. FSL H8-0548]OMF34656.1 ABC transporter permease [Paenibacillus sp. FSL H8-0548]